MAGFSKVVAIIFLMMMLVFATEVVTVAEARTCESLSHVFKGLCFSSSNCGNVCHREGFTGGVCRGFRRRCFCTKGCA